MCEILVCKAVVLTVVAAMRVEDMRERATYKRGSVRVHRKALLVLRHAHCPLTLTVFMRECCPRPTPLATFVHLAVGLLSAYEFLGTHHAVHLNATPESVLVDNAVPHSPASVLRDFSVAHVTAVDGTLAR